MNRALSEPQEFTGRISSIMPGIGPAMHRVKSIEVVQTGSPWRPRPRLLVVSYCGIRLTPPGTLYRPNVGDVTCPDCLEAS